MKIIKRLISSNIDKYKRDIFTRMSSMLHKDPVVYVKEFDSVFVLGKESDLFRRLIMKGYYEPELAELSYRYILDDYDVIDVGSNIGFYAVALGKKLKEGRVIALEPTKTAFKRLVQNIELNNLVGKVSCYNVAASNQIGKASINVIKGKEEYSSIGVMAHSSIIDKSYEVEEISCVTVDGLVNDERLRPKFMKIDVEGFEHAVLDGARKTLEVHRPIVLMELSDYLLFKNGSSSRAIVESMRSLGYRCLDPFTLKELSVFKDYGDALFIPKEHSLNA